MSTNRSYRPTSGCEGTRPERRHPGIRLRTDRDAPQIVRMGTRGGPVAYARTAAVRNNAAWCDTVCRVHGTPGERDPDAWTVPRRSPPWYPDAVTLRPQVSAAALLGRIDAGAGASVKDSFATLDLAPYGFRLLVEGEWIHRPADDVRDGPRLTPVTTGAALAGWADAHGGSALRHPALLADPAVTVLAAYDPAGVVTGGAVVNRGGGAAGVSNVFGDDPAAVWRGVCLSFGDGPLVGWATPDDLPAALDVGFRSVGPLRVWLHPSR